MAPESDNVAVRAGAEQPAQFVRARPIPTERSGLLIAPAMRTSPSALRTWASATRRSSPVVRKIRNASFKVKIAGSAGAAGTESLVVSPWAGFANDNTQTSASAVPLKGKRKRVMSNAHQARTVLGSALVQTDALRAEDIVRATGPLMQVGTDTPHYATASLDDFRALGGRGVFGLYARPHVCCCSSPQDRHVSRAIPAKSKVMRLHVALRSFASGSLHACHGRGLDEANGHGRNCTLTCDHGRRLAVK